MAFEINLWLESIINKLKSKFAQRLLFVGLQGSYNRNEATDESDIDLVVILDEFNFDDIKSYKNIINEMPYSEKACGFVSGQKELKNWSKSDLFQFFYDTKPLLGDLSAITAPPSKLDIEQSVKIGCENLYHAAVHSFLHSKNLAEDLISLYKMTFFILQSVYFLKLNEYIPTKQELLKKLDGADKNILKTCINREDIKTKEISEIEFLYNQLIKWCAERI